MTTTTKSIKTHEVREKFTGIAHPEGIALTKRDALKLCLALNQRAGWPRYWVLMRAFYRYCL